MSDANDGSLLLELLDPWVRTTRWFPAKDAADAPLRILTTIELPDPLEEAACTLVLLALDRGGATTVVQVPIVVTDPEDVELPGQIALLGTGSVLVDGPHHPAFLRAWLAASTTPAEPSIRLADLDPTRARVHTGEQSNTSVRIPAVTGDRSAILKIFRVLAPGANPEIEITRSLHEAGWRHVPEPLGWLSGRWPAPEAGTGPATGVAGDLGVLTAFLTGTEDGFELACTQAREDRSFAEPARELGRCIQSMHAVLRTALPVSEQSGDLAGALRARARWAIGSVPALQQWSEGVEQVISDVASHALPANQRIHGDLHLGQALRGVEDWFLLDFEGEPLRPLSERTAPDQPLRDLAGMLRSIDYAAAVGGATNPQWAEEARTALIEGYRYGAQIVEPAILRALELDKALYEAVYEQQNRPDWLSIPLGGIRRIIEEQAMRENDAPTPEPATPTGAPAHPPQASATPVPDHVLQDLSDGVHFAPHDVLGPHLGDGVVTIRTVRHLARAVSIRTADGEYPAIHERGGIWTVTFPAEDVPDYRVLTVYADGAVVSDDPYRFLPTVGEMDQHLISEGRHEELWAVLGARVRRYPSALGDVVGTSFAVWAPNARAVRVVGDFNHWDGRASAMRSLGSSGVWEIFLPEVRAGQRYKYEICHADGSWHTKADPMARATEVPPATASVVDESTYTWSDQAWMSARASGEPHSGPMSTYEVHLGSWRQGLTYVELAQQLVEYVSWMGFTHVELLPVAEHPFGGSWGYQVTSYYAPTSRFGSPDEFRHLVDALHQAGIGVIVDWVPAHFPKDSWALARFDGTPLYEDPDPLRGEQLDWGTYVFNFGRNEVRNFLVANALYWFTEFHIDGLRVDAVASMLYLDYSREPGQWRPNVRGGRENLEAIQFLQETNATAYRVAPGIMMIAEESTAWPGVTTATEHGGLGFGLKWNMGWMNDTLQYMAEEPINRRYHHGELTFSLVYAFSEQFVLPLSHDEVVHGKGSLWERMPGDLWAKLAGVRLLLAYQWSHPGKNLLFMGGEFAQNTEWAESRSLDWGLSDTPSHAGVRLMVRELNALYVASPALWADDFNPSGFEWIEANDGDHNVLAYLRRGGGEQLLVVANFAGTAHEGYRVAVPQAGAWEEVLNTDHTEFGGSGVVNTQALVADEVPWHGRSHSIALRVPPLGVTFLRPTT
ncbi:1,4-alpha-glucan branching protein GlgB [Ruania halotolerans]|uniref:1,4-alpha-glucan branching protein GlgB n=1 Tax=Ruania halotolerans TaxID=2897773 RepID=UPI001E4AD837|nr:1,4-alpha-glucan branching protein GlgB [Ruania halotolerans]UFU07681.1 1,4-alpha-glucan branching protein GlgB [Ruania halotolerans]